MRGHTHGATYTYGATYIRRDMHMKGYTHGATYIRMDIHMEETCTSKDIQTEQHTHEEHTYGRNLHIERTYTWREIHTKGKSGDLLGWDNPGEFSPKKASRLVAVDLTRHCSLEQIFRLTYWSLRVEEIIEQLRSLLRQIKTKSFTRAAHG